MKIIRHEWDGNVCTRCQLRRDRPPGKSGMKFLSPNDWKFRKGHQQCIPRYRKLTIREEVLADPEFHRKVAELLQFHLGPEYNI